MNKETAFPLPLPRWAQLRMTGPNIGVALAKEVIFATDVFLTSFAASGGNNRDWEEAVRTRMGVSTKSMNESPPYGTPEAASLHREMEISFELQSMWREAGKSVSTQYVKNDWASCCFIGGPHGWCSPAGEIYFSDNVGKYPSVQDIYEDLEAIAKRWPTLVFTATLMDGESGSDDTLPVVTMKGEGGVITFLDYEVGDLNFAKAHYAPVVPVNAVDRFAALWSSGRFREQGLPQEWVDEFADSVKAFVNANRGIAERKIDERRIVK